MKDNLYTKLVNFYNVNDENFKEFMSELYKRLLENNRDVKYVKDHLSDEIEKLLEDIRLEHERDEAEETIRIQEYMSCPSSTSTDFELPDDKELPF